MRTSKISSVLDEVLKPLGFMRKSRHWSRIGDSISDIIFLDSPRGTSGAMLEFGVLHSSVYKIVWQKSQNHYLDIADSTVRAQPHDLSGSSLDYLWKTESQKDIEEIVSCTVSMVQHFLEKMHSLEAARDWMLSPVSRKWGVINSIYLSSACKLLGDKNNACEILRDIASKDRSNWRTRVLELLASFECSSCST